MEKILILGVGNILLKDEAIGVRAAEYIQEHWLLPENVTVMEGGTLGIMLMDAMMDANLLFVLDAVLGGDKPGSIYRMVGDDLRKSLAFRDSTHQMDLVDTLIYCDLAGNRPDAVVLGVEPENYTSLETGLTPTIEAALPRLLDALKQELAQHGISVELKN